MLSVCLTTGACEHDPLPSAGGGNGGGFVVETFVGEWFGTWTNTTTNATGPATLVVSADGDTLTAVLDLDGDVFGLGNPPPQTLFAAVGIGAAVFSPQSSPVYGQLSGRIEADGTVTARVFDVPGGDVREIDVLGEWLASSVELDATITYAPGRSPDQARAVLSLSRQ